MPKKKRTPQHRPRKKKKSGGFFGKLIFCLFLGVILYFGMNTLTYAETLKFAQISDVHLSDKTVDTSYKVLASSYELFKDEIEQINETPNVDFVIVTGDLVDKPRKSLVDDACKQMNKLKAPWYFAFGNHDAAVGTSFKKDDYFEFIKQNNKNIKSDKQYYSFIPKKGYRAIVLDPTIDTRITANGELPKEQLDWLDTELSKAKLQQQIPLIFMHNPLQEPFPSFHHRILNAQELQAVLDKYDMPIAIFTGHYQPGGVLIYTMHDARPELSIYTRQTVATVKHESIYQGIISMARGRMYHQPFWLVDDYDIIVLINNIKRDVAWLRSTKKLRLYNVRKLYDTALRQGKA